MQKKLLIVLLVSFLGLTDAPICDAQLPADLPWPGSNVDGQDVILQKGIAGASCGTTVFVPVAERFTFGMFNIKDGVDGTPIVPANGRTEETANTEVYHHPSWTVEEIGNVFGVAVNEQTGDVFLTASSNYGADFFEEEAVLRYGEIGGGAENLLAAGTVYRVDAVTGQASVFVALPQQETTFTHRACEGFLQKRRTTGVGLGNIHYDKFHDQYFVTNIEDGRIYRLGPDGSIRDSYDPGIYDDGIPGVSEFTDLVNGIAVEPDGTRLFFGGLGLSRFRSVPLWSIDLTSNGGFAGAINNSVRPVGATYDNFVDANETLHTRVTIEPSGAVGGFHQISDLEFSPGPKLLVGIRVGCEFEWASSYNHSGESNEISPVNGTYNSISEFDVSFDDNRREDAYGGVSYHMLDDGSVDYVVSSSDILDEPGPHGLAVFHSLDIGLSPISPLAAISYGVVDNDDPKGVGGSVDVFNRCLLGDVNLDGIVNFLDISPFIAVLTTREYQCEADIDQNGTVNFLDISPFIAILSGS